MEKLKVFLSWSGPRSKAVAEALRTWLPDVLPMTEPWLSAADIEPGAKWRQAISGELETTNFAILCLTPGNLLSPWLLFEAGALSKLSDSRVCTYLVDLNPTDVKDPLSQFQHTRANESETKQLVATINKKLGDMSLDDPRLDRTFARCWPEFEKALKTLPSEVVEAAPKNPMEKVPEMVAEILERVREQARASPVRNMTDLGHSDETIVLAAEFAGAIERVLAKVPNDVGADPHILDGVGRLQIARTMLLAGIYSEAVATFRAGAALLERDLESWKHSPSTTAPTPVG